MPVDNQDKQHEKATRVGWRMAALAGETASYLLAGALLGWGIEVLFGIKWGILIGAVVGILCGMMNLIRGSLRLNAQLDEQARKRRDP
jgi:F0F1-type ATP synthase assembly protein I